MKFIIVFAALFAVALAAPGGSDADAQTVRQESDVGPESFQHAVETSNGIKESAEGHLNNVGTEQEALSVRGSFQYVGDDGITYAVSYVADENGFQPQGAHLPVAPEA